MATYYPPHLLISSSPHLTVLISPSPSHPQVIALSPRGYLKDSWNRLDAFIVVISYVAMFDVGSGISALRSLRTLRALRPLRFLSRYPSLQLVVEALFSAMPAVADVIFVLLVFWLVFGILACQLFGSQLRTCNLYIPPGVMDTGGG